MRKTIVAGNWKMNKTPGQTSEFLADMRAKLSQSKSDAVFCVPAICIPAAVEALKGSGVAVGAQNMHFEENGAYTGETAPAMLKEAGVKYVIIGHSERRAYYAETDETVNKKAIKALEHGLIPILCVGETLKEREQGITIDLVRMQVKIAFNGISKSDATKTVVAYEPVWAIGTGKTATSQQAEEVCSAIRKVLYELYSDAAEEIRIQYGGSVTPDNAAELFGMPNIDGGLVGGASLKPDFDKIVNYGA